MNWLSTASGCEGDKPKSETVESAATIGAHLGRSPDGTWRAALPDSEREKWLPGLRMMYLLRYS